MLAAMSLYGLTQSCLVAAMTIVVCSYHAFENNFGVNHKFTKYLKESFGVNSDHHFSSKIFSKNTLELIINS